MFAAIARWFKAVGYLLTGRIDSARKELDTDPHVVRAKYDEIVSEKTTRIHQYKQAVGSLIAQQENKISKVKILTDDVKRLENLKAGALAKAKQRVAVLNGQGKTKEEIQKDEEYGKCLSAYNDFNSTLAEKQARIEELESDIDSYRDRIKEHKIQLQQLLREIEKIKAESADFVADIITAKQEKDIADAFAGIAEDGTAKELQRMRELRQEIKAEARISSELAGTDTRLQEAEFLDYARTAQANDEFEALVGLAAQTESGDKTEPETENQKTANLPE